MSISTLVHGKPALGQELGMPSLPCQLDAGRAFLRGCKAVGDPVPLRWYLSLTFPSSCSEELQLTLLFHPRPFVPCQGTEKLRLLLRQAICTQNSLGAPSAQGVFVLENDSRHSGCDFFQQILSIEQRGRLGCRARDQGLCVHPQLHLPEKDTAKQAEERV